MPSDDGPAPPTHIKGKTKVAVGVSFSDVYQLLFGKFQGSKGLGVPTLQIGEGYRILQESDRRFCPLSQVIDPLAGHKHLSLEGHLRRVLVTHPMKEAPDVASSSSVVSNG
jgi:hypothetical protein